MHVRTRTDAARIRSTTLMGSFRCRRVAALLEGTIGCHELLQHAVDELVQFDRLGVLRSEHARIGFKRVQGRLAQRHAALQFRILRRGLELEHGAAPVGGSGAKAPGGR